jgi:lysophospholipase L1-like esterase
MSCSCGRDHNNTGDTGPPGDVTQAQLTAGLATKYNITGGTITGNENVTGSVTANAIALTGALGTTGLRGSNVNSSFLESAFLNMNFPPGSGNGLTWNVQDGNTTCLTVNNAANGAGIGTTGTIGSTAGSLILGNGITSFTTTLTQGAPTSAITVTMPSVSGTLSVIGGGNSPSFTNVTVTGAGTSALTVTNGASFGSISSLGSNTFGPSTMGTITSTASGNTLGSTTFGGLVTCSSGLTSTAGATNLGTITNSASGNTFGNSTVNGTLGVTGTMTTNALQVNSNSVVSGTETVSNLQVNINATVSGVLTTGGTINASNGITANTLTITKQTYAPLTMSSTIDFYGDSITAGFLLPTPTTQRWASLVCASITATQNNQAIGGSQVMDSSAMIYNNRAIGGGGNTLSLAYGVNDVTQILNIEYVRRIMLASIMYGTLPAANVLNIRSGSVTKGGSWHNSPYTNIGMGTTSPYTGTSLTASVTGRYVSFAATIFNDSNNANATCYNVTVDGVATSSTPLNWVNFNVTTGNGANSGSMLWMYDTLVSTSHTIVITPSLLGTYTQDAQVDWIAGFNQNQSGCQTVLVVPPTIYDINQIGGTQFNIDAYYKMLRDITRYIRVGLGLPVYFCSDPFPYNTLGQLYDFLHPNITGHQYIASQVLSLIHNGEANYLSN